MLYFWKYDKAQSISGDRSIEFNQKKNEKAKVYADQVTLSQSAQKKIQPDVKPKFESPNLTVDNSTLQKEEIPWEEITKEWHETLKLHLFSHLGVNEDKVEQLFNQFMEEKTEFERISKYLNQKIESSYILDEDNNVIDVRDERMLEETRKQMNHYHNNYVTKVKKIFGTYYTSLSELCRSYSRDLPYPNIYADGAFVE